MAGLVVGGDGDVDEHEGGVGVAEGDDGDVDVGGLADGLVVDTGVGDDDEAGLFERACDVVGEGAGGEAACDGLCACVGSIFEDCAVSVRTGRDDADVVRVFDGSNNASGQDEFFPGFSNIEKVNAVLPSLPNVRFHLFIAIFCANVTLCGEEEPDLLVGRAEH